jgi:hypothetical protein
VINKGSHTTFQVICFMGSYMVPLFSESDRECDLNR